MAKLRNGSGKVLSMRPAAFRAEAIAKRDFQPTGRRGPLEVAAEIRQLFNFGRHDSRFRRVLLGDAAGPAYARRQGALAVAAAGYLAPEDLSITDQSGSELRGTPIFTSRAA